MDVTKNLEKVTIMFLFCYHQKPHKHAIVTNVTNFEMYVYIPIENINYVMMCLNNASRVGYKLYF